MRKFKLLRDTFDNKAGSVAKESDKGLYLMVDKACCRRYISGQFVENNPEWFQEIEDKTKIELILIHLYDIAFLEGKNNLKFENREMMINESLNSIWQEIAELPQKNCYLSTFIGESWSKGSWIKGISLDDLKKLFGKE